MATIEIATRPLTPRDFDFKASASCLNCGALRSGPFCAQCGQQQSIRFVTLGLLFWTLAQLYRQSIVLTLTKALVVHLVYLFFSVVTGFAAVWLYFWFIHR